MFLIAAETTAHYFAARKVLTYDRSYDITRDDKVNKLGFNFNKKLSTFFVTSHLK